MARVDSSPGMADDELSRQRRRVDCFLAGLYPAAVVGLATQASLMLSLSSLDPRDAMAVRPTAQALQQLGLAHPAAAVEHEELRPARARELLQDLELVLSSNELWLPSDGHGERIRPRAQTPAA